MKLPRALLVTSLLAAAIACGDSSDSDTSSTPGNAAGAGGGSGGSGGASGPQGGKPVWLKTFGSKGEDVSSNVSVDAAGNIYLSGYFEDVVSFGGEGLTSAGDQDAFVAKLDGQGNHVWSKRFGDKGLDAVGAAVADGDGNVFIAGVFSETISLGAEAVATKGGVDMFVARLDRDGNTVWSKTFGSTGDDIARQLLLSPAGEVIVVGVMEGEIDFGGGPLVARKSDGFVVKLDKDGKHLKSQLFGGEGNDILQSAALGPDGDLWLSGGYGDKTDVGTGMLPWVSGDSGNGWVLRVAPDGKVKWVRTFGGAKEDAVTSVAVDAKGNALFTITFEGPAIDLGQGPLQSAGFYEMAFGMLGPDGAPLWGKVFGSGSPDGAFGTAFDAQGNGYITGLFSNSVDFGTGTLDATSFLSNFALKVDPSGKAIWAKDLGPSSINNFALFNAVIVDPASGGVIITGHFDGEFDFGSGSLENKGKGDIFLAKYAP